MIPLRYACPLAELLAICLLLDLVAAVPFPGVAYIHVVENRDMGSVRSALLRSL